MSFPRGHSEQERLNASFNGHGYSAGLEISTGGPLSPGPALSPASPRSPRSPQEERQLRQTIRLIAAAIIFGLLVATMIALLAATVIRCRREGGAGCLIPKQKVPLPWGGASLWPVGKTVSRIAFGSCAAYDARPQPVWEEADEALFECSPQNLNASQCQCTPDWLKQPPFMCMAGELDNARDKMVAQVTQPGYQAFLRYMCPRWESAAVGGGPVPPGDDLSACPRPVLGTYDDHDYGINNFNRRLPNKQLFKQVYLDGLGVSATSPRRAAQRGIQWRHTLNPDTPRQVELILLDERYERDPLPCQIRDEWCRNIVLQDKAHPSFGWCQDFLETGGEGRTGSCCKADHAIFYGWCLQAANRKDPLWEVACDPASPKFGSQALAVQPDGRLAPRDVQYPEQAEQDSSFCELLGWEQRQWLETVLAASTAPVKVIASGSVLFGSTPLDNNTAENQWQGRCSGDDWDCYRPAQLNLLHTLQRHAAATKGCYIVITGDYHYSDIKVAKPGADQLTLYSDAYQTGNWSTPIYQVMASGMTNSTARPDAKCEGYRKEWAGLRIEGECGFVKLPSFGMLEIDWDARRLSMQIRGAESPQGGKVLQQLTISLDTCQPV
ncbi:hypothetical protein COHA_004751 [Chlorella ohadii]|uniref:PhoD-like phosphatase metallophosphatase domain-containing protein n=1 Tax=Chlorella ohadii TaxID=2649997 RepID=A0AAD5H2L8_9CHLO|nr:hypothetical protein COHA_004751 [Chlorella ohadii]